MIFGRKLDQPSEDEQAQLGNAAAVLGANVLTGNLASSVGLDEARIETGSSREDAAFVAGKYLSPKLYVSYGVGLFEPVNTLRIRYSLTSKLTLQAQTGTYDATDILFRIERGR
jgi:translocation and assembly module TamB